LQALDKNEEVLLFAAGPVGNRPCLRAEVVIRAFLQSAHGPMKPTQGELAKMQFMSCRPLPTRLSVPGAYASSGPFAERVRDWIVTPLEWWLVPDTDDWLLPERQSRGLHVPAGWLLPDAPTIVVEPDQVHFRVGDQQVGRYRYWHDELRERSYPKTSSRVGGELLLRQDCLEPQLSAGATLCWIVTLSIAQRGEYKDTFEDPHTVGNWLVGGSHIVWPNPWLPQTPSSL
jgi:hypothetical protein